jgi:predicted nucleotide-binding protein
LTLFSSKKILSGFGSFRVHKLVDMEPQARLTSIAKSVKEEISTLKSIRYRLGLFSEKKLPIKKTKVIIGNRVFVVHGHDEISKAEVSRFLEKLGLEAVVLHEKSNRGKTIIEKIEAHSDVSFAVVLMTPDDIAYSKKNPRSRKSRARQNVILELGYFVAKLGRERVAALKEGSVEEPSDFSGVIYIQLGGDSWKTKLAKELKDAGLSINTDKLLD